MSSLYHSIIVLRITMFIFSDINCISICKLNRFIVDLSSAALIRRRDVILPCGGPVEEMGQS